MTLISGKRLFLLFMDCEKLDDQKRGAKEIVPEPNIKAGATGFSQ